jgi:hypothetical protein
MRNCWLNLSRICSENLFLYWPYRIYYKRLELIFLDVNFFIIKQNRDDIFQFYHTSKLVRIIFRKILYLIFMSVESNLPNA